MERLKKITCHKLYLYRVEYNALMKAFGQQHNTTSLLYLKQVTAADIRNAIDNYTPSSVGYANTKEHLREIRDITKDVDGRILISRVDYST